MKGNALSLVRTALARLRAWVIAPASASAGKRSVARAIEIVVLATLVPLAGRLLFPFDPLGLDAGFPWAALGPLVVAARYGVGAGLGCAMLAVATFALPAAVYAERGGELTTLAVGTLLLSLIAGDMSGAWRRRALRSEAQNAYLGQRLEEFSRDYHVLKVSHGQLEEFVAGQRTSLRGALLALRPALVAAPDAEAGGLGDGRALMAVFARFCSVQVAGLYAMRSDTLVEPEPLAVHGGMGELPLFDPLLRLAIGERRLASVRPEAAAAEQHASALLAVVPIVDSRERLHGVLAIRDMHFMAFQERNLNLLALLAGYVGDLVARGGGLDDAPADRFIAELDTALRFARSHEVRSSLLRLRFVPHARREEIVAFVAGGIRGLDAAWIAPRRDGDSAFTTVVVLLPLAGERGARAWLLRTARAVRERFDVELSAQLVSCRLLVLDGRRTRRDAIAFIAESEGSDRAGERLEADDGEWLDDVA